MPSSDSDRLVGIDVGGTKMLAVAVDRSSPTTIVGEHRVATEAGVEALFGGVRTLLDVLDPGGSTPVGLGVPGLVEQGGVFRYGPNLPDVVDLDVAADFGARLGRSFVVDNDATCATYAEFTSGAGRGHDDGLLITLGTGIGAGIVVDGHVRHGAHGFAGEPGHMMVDPNGPLCPCGRRGCWERFASGTGLGRLGREAAVAGRLGAAIVAAGGEIDGIRGEHVVAVARNGDPEAAAVLDEFAWWIAAGVANLIDILDPSVVVLGGGVIDAADTLLERVRRALGTQVLGHGHRPRVDVVAAAFDSRAGAVGAAVLAGERFASAPQFG